MYAKIENGVAVEYPVYEGQLEPLFPNLRFPLDDPKSIEANGGYVIPEGYVWVEPTESGAALDYGNKYELGMPVFDPVRTVWKQVWVKTPLTEQELQDKKPYASNDVRFNRDKKLLESDIKVMVDVWATYTDQQKAEWTAYRQALRDLPNQAGFPYAIEWPTSPSAFIVRTL